MPQPKHRQPIDVSEFDPALLDKIGRHSLQQIHQLRRHERIEVRFDILVQPGNSSNLGRYEARGHTKDVSRGGCRCILPRAPMVGDLYRVELFEEENALPVAFARCVRCQFLKEGSFDCAFAFFSPLDAPETISGSKKDDLLD